MNKTTKVWAAMLTLMVGLLFGARPAEAALLTHRVLVHEGNGYDVYGIVADAAMEQVTYVQLSADGPVVPDQRYLYLYVVPKGEWQEGKDDEPELKYGLRVLLDNKTITPNQGMRFSTYQVYRISLEPLYYFGRCDGQLSDVEVEREVKSTLGRNPVHVLSFFEIGRSRRDRRTAHTIPNVPWVFHISPLHPWGSKSVEVTKNGLATSPNVLQSAPADDDAAGDFPADPIAAPPSAPKPSPRDHFTEDGMPVVYIRNNSDVPIVFGIMRRSDQKMVVPSWHTDANGKQQPQAIGPRGTVPIRFKGLPEGEYALVYDRAATRLAAGQYLDISVAGQGVSSTFSVRRDQALPEMTLTILQRREN